MDEPLTCDIAIVGGGLAGGLAALALAERRPELRVLLVDPGPIGGNHVWSFFDADVALEHRWLVDPLICASWEGNDIRFPAHSRTLKDRYNAIFSERLDERVRAALGDRIVTMPAVSLTPTDVVLADQRRIVAAGVIDARGAGDLSLFDVGWQKFAGRELILARPHGLTRPVIMDATVPQIDGYRFVYLLPFAEDRIFVEDTYYSDTPDLDPAAIHARIDDYARAAGWEVTGSRRVETGVLPVAMGGDFEGYWGTDGVAKLGLKAGLFHPTTGYSLPDAVRTAAMLTTLPDLSGPALHDALHGYAREAWNARGFYRLLDTMLFRAADPPDRYRVLERFYRLDEGLVGRFYAGRSTFRDKARVLIGRPPVPLMRAIGVIMRNKG